jgi:hypothetical protein
VVLLDTHVVSELMRQTPDPAVQRWVDAQPAFAVRIAAVTVAEIRLGLALLPRGKRRDRLTEAAEAMFADDFGESLPFDSAAAREYGDLVAARIRLGRPVSVEDGQIAAIARAAGLTIATRNVRDFERIDRLTVINPWQAVD